MMARSCKRGRRIKRLSRLRSLNSWEIPMPHWRKPWKWNWRMRVPNPWDSSIDANDMLCMWWMASFKLWEWPKWKMIRRVRRGVTFNIVLLGGFEYVRCLTLFPLFFSLFIIRRWISRCHIGRKHDGSHSRMEKKQRQLQRRIIACRMNEVAIVQYLPFQLALVFSTQLPRMTFPRTDNIHMNIFFRYWRTGNWKTKRLQVEEDWRFRARAFASSNSGSERQFLFSTTGFSFGVVGWES